MLGLGFEIAFILTGVAALAVWHFYMVGTIVAIFNVVRLGQLRAAFAAPQATVPGYGQPSFPPPGYGQPFTPHEGGQPGAAQRSATMPPGRPMGPGQPRRPGQPTDSSQPTGPNRS